MWLRALVAGALLAGLLGACAVVDPVDSRYDTVSRSLAKARNEAIFLNLVRASHDYPLSFTTIANVTPTLTNTSSFALPSFSVGPPNCLPGLSGGTHSITCGFATGVPGAATAVGSSTASNATAVSTNFNVATQETSAFYLGFLKPIDLQTLDYFIRQGYPRELLFWLFADSFQYIPTPDPRTWTAYQYSPPDSYGCPHQGDPYQRCFRQWVWIALLTGLTVEEQSFMKESRPTPGTNGGSNKPETIVVARFCFSPELAKQAENQMGPTRAAQIKAKYMKFGGTQPSPVCGNWKADKVFEFAKLPQPDTFDFKVGNQKFHVVSRSAYGVFSFLGNLMRMKREDIPPTPGKANYWSPDEIEIPPRLVTLDDNPSLLDIRQRDGQDAADCFAHTWFKDGDYCAPESSATTKQIFGLLAQLIAIQTAASDLSITPVVRVIQ
jgi:hypothetical protein